MYIRRFNHIKFAVQIFIEHSLRTEKNFQAFAIIQGANTISRSSRLAEHFQLFVQSDEHVEPKLTPGDWGMDENDSEFRRTVTFVAFGTRLRCAALHCVELLRTRYTRHVGPWMFIDDQRASVKDFTETQVVRTFVLQMRYLGSKCPDES